MSFKRVHEEFYIERLCEHLKETGVEAEANPLLGQDVHTNNIGTLLGSIKIKNRSIDEIQMYSHRKASDFTLKEKLMPPMMIWGAKMTYHMDYVMFSDLSEFDERKLVDLNAIMGMKWKGASGMPTKWGAWGPKPEPARLSDFVWVGGLQGEETDLSELLNQDQFLKSKLMHEFRRPIRLKNQKGRDRYVDYGGIDIFPDKKNNCIRIKTIPRYGVSRKEDFRIYFPSREIFWSVERLASHLRKFTGEIM
ncbi:MAG: hypothetical protein ABIH76_01435 [Candidatus Bathyarchaeota archaeon]